MYVFGAFQVDTRSHELRRNGVRIKIQDQPFLILVKLLERPGQLVTREELRSALWNGDTFVDFDTGLNTAVKRLREALGDSAESPTFVETLPKLGYRFVAPVQRLDVIERGIPSNRRLQEQPPRTNWGKRLGIVAGAAALILLCFLVWPNEPQPPRIVGSTQITNDQKPKNSTNLAVTDGVRLYFSEYPQWVSSSSIAQVSTAGGEVTWIPTALKVLGDVQAISPDFAELLVINGLPPPGELWGQPLPSGAPHRVGNLHAQAACWTPNGTHIVFSHNDEISIAKRDGSEAHTLVKTPGVAYSLRFSPDGKRLRFNIGDPQMNSSSIWEMQADGKGLHPLFPDWKDVSFTCCGSWSPDGRYYYFQVKRGNSMDLWVLPDSNSVLRKSAAAPVRLTTGPLHFGSPVPSSDGKKLFAIGENARVELMRYDVKANRLDPYLSGISAGPVDFSADRQWITYVSYPEGTLWKIKSDGSERIQLTYPPVRAYEPRWSPDGSQIAFMDVQLGRTWRILLIPSSGGTPQELLTENYYQADPTWTPDGNSIVFGRTVDMEPEESRGICKIELKTRHVVVIPGSEKLFSPRLSPDGRYIVALLPPDADVTLYDSNSASWSRLSNKGYFEYQEWSHDGKYVYMRQDAPGTGNLVRLRIPDGKLESLMAFKDFPQVVDLFTLWIGLTPDDSPLLMRDRSVQEIYALDLKFR
jgi:Tol biopolymer transport system component/DNA-binding winged helix-turn-helix (wHTH) protein